MKTFSITFTPVLFVLACLMLLPRAQAVVPAPDGGYPGGNTAEGQSALLSLTTGQFNTAVGLASLASETEGNFNTAIGAATLVANTAGGNTAMGAAALLSNTTGDSNTANGAFALLNNTTGVNNTAVGTNALVGNTDGSHNTAIGAAALTGNTTGSGNIALGDGAGSAVTGASNVICIGSPGENIDRSCYIGNIYGQTFGPADMAVRIGNNGKLGTLLSSRRFKYDIEPMDDASEAVLALKPVTFYYNSDATKTRRFGLIAEDVLEISPGLVIPDKEGKPLSVRYEDVNAMLLNEFLKEHRKVEEQGREIQEQKSAISALKKGMESVVARLKDQDSKIQEVGAQVETSKAATKIVVNSP